MAQYVVVASGTGDVQAYTGATEFHGYSVSETAGTPGQAAVVIRDGTSGADPPVALIELAANVSETRTLPSVNVGTGLFIDRIAGETTLVLYIS